MLEHVGEVAGMEGVAIVHPERDSSTRPEYIGRRSAARAATMTSGLPTRAPVLLDCAIRRRGSQ
jgi:hypothetical protein